MISHRLLSVYRELLDTIEHKELGTIDRLAKITADSIAKGGSVYIHDRGHLLSHELFLRSGGLALIRQLFMTVEAGSEPGGDLLLAERTIEESGLKAGDILLLGSVSGRAASVVEMAIQAKKRGIVTIAMTAMDYTSQTPSQHPSGQRLYEACEHVLDIHTMKGDAALEVEGLGEKIMPTSGFTSAVVGWCFIAQVIEHLLALGIEPTVYRSVSMPNGEELVEKAKARFQELGY
ncbi:sugar isomerase domain-containing protein [Paenibacillus cymbidii]|uniref:sugar isomerase domain-containing protein n=1 Tax=Paenibacillus cymbidii TaxID=1639034 RepID=UPI001081E32A|nr:sugar isomerase domain-containing protein [Paenibacillus cymbidii]